MNALLPSSDAEEGQAVLWCEGWNEGGQTQPITYACPSCGVDQQVELPVTRVSPSQRDDNLVSNIIISTLISGL